MYHHTISKREYKLILIYFQLLNIVPTQILRQNTIHVSAACSKVQSGRYKVTRKRDRPLTYEMANPPHYIAHRKAWNSWNTCKNLIRFLLFDAY